MKKKQITNIHILSSPTNPDLSGCLDAQTKKQIVPSIPARARLALPETVYLNQGVSRKGLVGCPLKTDFVLRPTFYLWLKLPI